MKNIKKAFTLIELLIVIAIVGILSGFIFISMSSATNAAQDARRKSDLSNIQKALIMYQVSGNSYPVSAGCTIGDTGCLDTELADYLTIIPTDPDATKHYTYVSDGVDFTLSTTLSNGGIYSYNTTSGWVTSSGALAAWSYHKQITVNNTGSVLTNYQMMFTIYRSTGTDANFNVYVGTNCLSNYNDIRFTNVDGTLLDYWIESFDSSSATIWVEADSLVGSGNTTLYFYYGNPVAVAVSNGTNTFPFFDDFSGASMNTALWYRLNADGTTTITSGVVRVQGAALAYEGWVGKTELTPPFALRSRCYFSTEGGDTVAAIGLDDRAPSGSYAGSGIDQSVFLYVYDGGSGKKYMRNLREGSSTVAYYAPAISTPYKVLDIITSSSSVKYYIDGGLESSLTSNIPTDMMSALMQARANSVYADWVLLRNYITTEPTISAWGTEESL